ncbi:hypothetical protein [Luteolibacter marinus]|uniref:hypothetical protein n=1 Tax=Luteolibacter marinus TaxID=2776705 RepID=UPI001868A1FE|nr:hypothetical protein [Luteolibacter marinus]
MKSVLAIALLLAFSQFTFADSWVPQTPQTVASPQGEFLLRAIPPKRLDDQGEKWSNMLFIVYQLDQGSQGYREMRRFEVEGSPIRFLINDRGDRIVTLDQQFGIGQGPRVVVVYDGKGNELKKWALKDFYDKKKIKDLTETTTSVFWRGDAGWMSDQKGVWLSKPVPPSGKNADLDDYLLDVRGLKISKRSNPDIFKK